MGEMAPELSEKKQQQPFNGPLSGTTWVRWHQNSQKQQQQQQPFNGPLSGTTWVRWHQNSQKL